MNRGQFLINSAGIASGATLSFPLIAKSRQRDEFQTMDACALAALVASKDVQASEILEATIAGIERLNPHLNALVTPITLYETARQRLAQTVPVCLMRSKISPT